MISKDVTYIFSIGNSITSFKTGGGLGVHFPPIFLAFFQTADGGEETKRLP